MKEWFSLLFLLGLLLLVMVVIPSTICNSRAQMMQMNSRWGLFTGCMVEVNPGQFIPINSYRYDDQQQRTTWTPTPELVAQPYRIIEIVDTDGTVLDTLTVYPVSNRYPVSEIEWTELADAELRAWSAGHLLEDVRPTWRWRKTAP